MLQVSHRISFLNLVKAFIVLYLPVAGVNNEQGGFESKFFLTIDNGRLLAFTKLRTDH